MTRASGTTTLAAVAAAAGVSRTTASRVLNGAPSVRSDVRERVLDVIERLDYRPDAVARSLRRRRTGLIGLVVPHEPRSAFADGYLGALVRATTQACDAADLTLTLLMVGTVAQQRRANSHLRHGSLLDGVVVVASHDDAASRLLRPSTIPTVVVGDPGETEVTSVDVDNLAGGRIAAEHLIACGRRRFAVVAGPADNAAARARHHGAVATLAEAGLVPVVERVVDFSVAAGRASARAVVSASADAVVAGSDAIAAGVLDGLGASGRRVPDDVAVVGFDDLPAATTTSPPLTTVAQPIDDVARLAVERLADLVESSDGDGATVDRTVLDVELVERLTTARPGRPTGSA